MKHRLVKRFLSLITTDGHEMVSKGLSIDSDKFDVFCSSNFFSDNENYQMLLNQEQGCYLYTNNGIANQNFVQNFKSFLGNKIVNEVDIVSNIFNNRQIKILVIKVNDDEFRLIYEMHSADRLRIL